MMHQPLKVRTAFCVRQEQFGPTCPLGSNVTSRCKPTVTALLDKNIQSPKVTVTLKADKGLVDITVTGVTKTPFFGMLGLGGTKSITANANARILGGLPLCILALGETAEKVIEATNEAKVTTLGCSTHANATDSEAISATSKALLHTGLTCSSGGTADSVVN